MLIFNSKIKHLLTVLLTNQLQLNMTMRI